MSHRALGQQFVDLYHGTTGEHAKLIDEHEHIHWGHVPPTAIRNIWHLED